MRKLGEILDEALPASARTVVHESLLQAERTLEPRLTSPPEELDQGGVQAEPETERASKSNRTQRSGEAGNRLRGSDTGPGSRTHEWNFVEGTELLRMQLKNNPLHQKSMYTGCGENH